MMVTPTLEERRRSIVSAVWRLAAAGGLEQVSMRNVASAAGVSLRLVQYYFGTRDELLDAALVARRARDRDRIAAAAMSALSVQAELRATLLHLLPIDDEGRMMYLINVAYFIRALGDASKVEQLDHERELEERFLVLLRAADAAGELRTGLDLPLETERLLALQDGMSSRLLLQMRTAAEATALVNYHLEGIFR